jgi:hypothetical protein
MKKVLSIIIFTLSLLLYSCSDNVYVCTGPMSKKYHNTENCYGLRRCSSKIEKISIEKAERMNRMPCKFCYNKNE